MKVLIVKTSSMGDVIHTLPALSDAGKFYPDIKFDWVVEESFAEIPAWHKLVDKVIPIALRRWRKYPLRILKTRELSTFYKTLKSQRYDFIIDAQGLIKSALIAYVAKGVRCGMDKYSARESLAAYSYQRKISISKQQHAITRIRQLFSKVLDYKMLDDFPDYGIDISSDKENYLVFIHGTSRPSKLWPKDNWVALAKLAAGQGYTVKIPWNNPEEYDRARYIADQSDNVQILAKANLTEIANVLSKAKCVIAVDTGLGHLAAALNVPTISLYGPTDAKLIGTYGKSVKHLQTITPGIVDISATTVWEGLCNIIFLRR
jgi:heptosyltransferase-1